MLKPVVPVRFKDIHYEDRELSVYRSDNGGAWFAGAGSDVLDVELSGKELTKLRDYLTSVLDAARVKQH